MLFFLGAAGVLVSAIAVTSGFSWQAEDKSFLAIPAWSLVALPLAFLMRRDRPNSILSTFAGFWLALGFGAMLVTNYLG
ncbi:MAG: hypothetical protein JSR79_11555 [Proteobacteria bacterium]|nr:hypothetical protein [Pseudomonadota bacterium]